MAVQAEYAEQLVRQCQQELVAGFEVRPLYNYYGGGGYNYKGQLTDAIDRSIHRLNGTCRYVPPILLLWWLSSLWTIVD